MNQTYIQISQQDVLDQDVLKLKLTAACQMGFFYLEIPAACQLFIEKAVSFGHSFYANDEYKKLQLEGFSGFHDRETLQVEALYLEQKYWLEKMPAGLLELAQRMKAIAIDLLKSTLSICHIPDADWEKASGGATEDSGQVHFTFNHYRADKPNEGLMAHRDFGQITVLYIDQPGLQAKIFGNWQEVLPLKNHFIINFGRALESVVNNENQLTAAWHRVPRLHTDRISFGVFVDNNNRSEIYKREGDGLVNTGCLYEAYLNDSFSEHY